MHTLAQAFGPVWIAYSNVQRYRNRHWHNTSMIAAPFGKSNSAFRNMNRGRETNPKSSSTDQLERLISR